MLLALLQDRIDAPGMKQCADSAADFQAYGGPMGRNEMLRIGQVRADFDFQHGTGGNIMLHPAVSSFSLDNTPLAAAEVWSCSMTHD